MGGIQWPPWLRFIWPKHPWPFLETLKLNKNQDSESGAQKRLGGFNVPFIWNNVRNPLGHLKWSTRLVGSQQKCEESKLHGFFRITFWHDTFGSTPTDAGSLPSGLYDYIMYYIFRRPGAQKNTFICHDCILGPRGLDPNDTVTTRQKWRPHIFCVGTFFCFPAKIGSTSMLLPSGKLT